MIPITIGKPLILNVENESKKNTNVSRKFLEHNNQIYKSDEFFDVKKYKIYLTNELKNNSGLKHIKKIIDEIITDITFLNNTEDKIFILMDIICTTNTPAKFKQLLFHKTLKYMEKKKYFEKKQKKVLNLFWIYHSRYINLETLQKLDNMLSFYIYKYSKDSPSNRQIYLQFLANRYFTIAYSTETLGLILKTVKEIKNSHYLSLFELQLISKVVNKSDDRVDQKLIKRLKKIVEDYILNTIKNNQNELYTIINDSILKRDILNAVTSEVIFEIIKTISYNINTENDNDKWLRGFLALISSNKIQENKELCKRIRNLTIIKKLESEDNEIINYIETILGIKT